MSLIVLEWMIGVLCRKSAETEVNDIHSRKWVALLLVWGCIRAEGVWVCCGHGYLQSIRGFTFLCNGLLLPCPDVQKVLLNVHASLSSFNVPACPFHRSDPFPCSRLFPSTTSLLLVTCPRLVVGALCCLGSASLLSSPCAPGSQGMGFLSNPVLWQTLPWICGDFWEERSCPS